MKENVSCFTNLLKFIDDLQRNSDDCIEDEGCVRPFLGEACNCALFNTRPVTFYNCNNDLITIEYTSGGLTLESTVFRVDKVFDNCVKVTLLAINGDTYTSTGQTAIINLCCVCAIKCLRDTFVSL